MLIKAKKVTVPLATFLALLLCVPPATLHAQTLRSKVENGMPFAQGEVTCGPGAGPGESVLDGYELPATEGGTGLEDPVRPNGTLTTTGEPVTFSKHASLGKEYRDYYITMRWNYVAWNWSGTSADADNEQFSWMNEKPRLVHVTNPDTGKSIIAAAIEAGPAPWTGVDGGPNNNAKQGWSNPQRGTPPNYTGRVSGFPPIATEALGMDPNGGDQRTATGNGPNLLYAWAADQDATPGPVGANVTGGDTGGVPGCGGGSGMSAVIYNGHAFPVDARRQGDVNHYIGTLNRVPCDNPAGCHHTRGHRGANSAAAWDLGVPGPNGDLRGMPNPEGTPVYAIVSGKLMGVSHTRSFNKIERPCNQFRIVGDNGEVYWYGHLEQDRSYGEGKPVEVGQQVGRIGNVACADDTYPHLHIDMSTDSGSYSGDRNPEIITIVNELWERLPE